MANDICSSFTTGRLTRDAEIRATNSGSTVCTFSVASNWSKKVGDQWQEEVSFFDFVMFGRRAEALRKYLTKGQQVAILASPRQERWEKDGQKNSRVKFYVDDIRLTGGKGSGSGSSTDGYGSQRGDMGYSEGEDYEDSVPF